MRKLVLKMMLCFSLSLATLTQPVQAQAGAFLGGTENAVNMVQANS